MDYIYDVICDSWKFWVRLWIGYFLVKELHPLFFNFFQLKQMNC